MLLRSLFIVMLLTALVETALHGAMALANASVHQRALDVARADMLRVATMLQQTAATGEPMPSPQPACVAPSADGCAFFATTSVILATPAAAATPQLPGVCPQNSCTTYLQGNDSVAEGRIDATFSTVVTSAAGSELARRSAHAVLRTFAAPPYATLSGWLDDTEDAIAVNGTGDDGGLTALDGSAGTLVEVVYKNSTSGASTPANVWHPRTYYASPATEPWDR